MSIIDGTSAAYVCENFTCKAPATDPKHFAELLSNNYFHRTHSVGTALRAVSERVAVIAGDRSQAGAYSSLSLFTTWLNGGDSCQVGREVLVGKRLNLHFCEADQRTAEVWFRVTRAVDN